MQKYALEALNKIRSASHTFQNLYKTTTARQFDVFRHNKSYVARLSGRQVRRVVGAWCCLKQTFCFWNNKRCFCGTGELKANLAIF